MWGIRALFWGIVRELRHLLDIFIEFFFINENSLKLDFLSSAFVVTKFMNKLQMGLESFLSLLSF